jgi:hypothetical protein
MITATFFAVDMIDAPRIHILIIKNRLHRNTVQPEYYTMALNVCATIYLLSHVKEKTFITLYLRKLDRYLLLRHHPIHNTIIVFDS